MSSPTTSVDFDLPPVTPTLPVNPKIEDYERASEYERCKLAQIKRTFEQLKAEYSHLDDACTNAMAGQGQNPVENNGDVAKKETQASAPPFRNSTRTKSHFPTLPRVPGLHLHTIPLANDPRNQPARTSADAIVLAQAPQTPPHSKSSSQENTPAAGPASTGQHVRRKSSLNASAPAFVPGFLGGGGDSKGSPKSA
ncbi:hypothetical protein UCRNP2_3674 [Neofusicoccum parvum UCRNP2]|uniref:Uncharacterized protein n=1 Tax=Botryosphaeria parva (strain UCR-NP2) TaxID=1287680 RepID=R1GU48_BOTPV|nr:hypothetical protein UCRNP2_3674 [Neofusicoccum parvum UCRNP2]